MDPIYKFTLDKETGRVDVLEIKDYEMKNTTLDNPMLHYCRYRHNGLMYYAYLRDFDRFKNNHVYSFNPNKNSALIIMIDAIQARMDNAKNEHDKWQNIIKMLLDKEVDKDAGILE